MPGLFDIRGIVAVVVGLLLLTGGTGAVVTALTTAGLGVMAGLAVGAIATLLSFAFLRDWENMSFGGLGFTAVGGALASYGLGLVGPAVGFVLPLVGAGTTSLLAGAGVALVLAAPALQAI